MISKIQKLQLSFKHFNFVIAYKFIIHFFFDRVDIENEHFFLQRQLRADTFGSNCEFTIEYIIRCHL